MKRTTIIDIARDTGFSRSTVSLALRGGSNLKKTTVKKILKSAKKLNYYPDEMARSLASLKASNFIGLIVTDINNEWYVEIMQTIEESLSNSHYNIILCNTNYNLEKEADSVDILIRNRASGIIIASPQRNDKSIEKILLWNIPFVLIGSEVEKNNINTVSVDNYRGSRMAMEYLVSKGHRNIIHFTGPKNYWVTDARRKAYKDVMSENNFQFDERHIIDTNSGTYKSSYIAAKKLERLDVKPTAIFAYNDVIALAVWEYLMEKGYTVPEDISLVGFDGIRLSGFRRINLTTIRQPYEEIGNKSVEILLREIKNKNPNTVREKIYVEPELIERATVRDINRR